MARVWSERWFRPVLNLYPPFLFNRIRILHIGPGFRSCTVRVSRSLLTRNLNGTIFGGTIFSAADPFYALMYWQIFARRGERLRTWLKSARIEYLRPAASALRLEFVIDDADVERAVAALDLEGRYVHTHVIDVLDAERRVCARVENEVYLRRGRRDEPEASTF